MDRLIDSASREVAIGVGELKDLTSLTSADGRPAWKTVIRYHDVGQAISFGNREVNFRQTETEEHARLVAEY